MSLVSASAPSPRVAIYARFSTDMQREASIDDQVRVCTAHIDRMGGTVVEVFTDYAISGANNNRPGLIQLMAAVGDGRINMVVAEALDRVSRDQEHIAGIYKQLTFAGVQLFTTSEGPITELQIGFKGTMNALFLKDLGDKTHRGLEGRVSQGKSAGGKAFGYRIVHQLDARGEPIRGDRAIDPAEASIVIRIFMMFAAGHSPRAIAKALNTEGILGPDGGAWQDTTIRGHQGRGTGILRNQLYIGVMVWNRQRYIKDPATCKRVSRPNPVSEWKYADVPHLRIVDQDLWDRAQARLDGIRASDRSQKAREREFWKDRRPKHLLTGKAYCGCCGGSLATIGQDYLACSAARNKGTCENGRGIRRNVVETLILDALKSRLMAPELVKEFSSAFIAETNKMRAEAESGRVLVERDHASVCRKLTGLIDAIADGFRAPGLQTQLDDLERRKADLERRLSEPHAPQPRLHPNLAEVYHTRVTSLHDALADPASSTEAIEIIRSLIERIEVRPTEGKGFEIELIGDIANMIELGLETKKAAPGGAAVLGQYRSSVKVVAGARHHLPRTSHKRLKFAAGIGLLAYPNSDTREHPSAFRLLIPHVSGQWQFIEFRTGLAPRWKLHIEDADEPFTVGGLDQMRHLVDDHVFQ
nr:recombinase family protein [Magnetospirillum sp. ME-1]